MAAPVDAPAFRAKQLSFIEDEFSNLVEDDLGLKAVFLDLCCQTHEALGEHNWSHRACFRPCATSAWNLSSAIHDKTRAELPEALQARWLAWADDYARLIGRNPRLDLADRMQDISEMNDASSWPTGHEDALKAWVDADDITQYSFLIRAEFPSTDLYRDLQGLRHEAGGWLYQIEEVGRVMFVADDRSG